jgi:hypothetical protein
MPIGHMSPFVTETLVFSDDFSSYSTGAFTGGSVYSEWTLDGTRSWSIETGNILRGTVTTNGHGGWTVPNVYFHNGRVRVKIRMRETGSGPNPDNEQVLIRMRDNQQGRLLRDINRIEAPGIGDNTATITPLTWYIFELQIHNTVATARQFDETGTTLLKSVTNPSRPFGSAGIVHFGMAFEVNGSVDFDWIEVYKAAY